MSLIHTSAQSFEAYARNFSSERFGIVPTLETSFHKPGRGVAAAAAAATPF